MPSSKLKRDATGFLCVALPGKQKMWMSNDRHRAVVKRATNRFQAYEWIDDDHRHYSVGYVASRDDIRLFLSGHAVTMIAEFGEDTKAEPLTFQHPALITF